jgi:tRNA threonylcarbamoyladenosine biosynthesis protein TsaE
MVSLQTAGPEETLALGEFIGARLSPGDVVVLDAELGLGKTCLTKGIARGVGRHDPASVTSPAFTLVNEYAADGAPTLYHMDFYRLEQLAPTDEQLLGEYLRDEQAVSVIEWGARFADRLAPDHLEIHLDQAGAASADARRITIEPRGHGARYAVLIAALESRADARR